MPDREEPSLHRWIVEQNIVRYRTMLADEYDPSRCELIQRLLDQELKTLSQMDGEKHERPKPQPGPTGPTFARPQK